MEQAKDDVMSDAFKLADVTKESFLLSTFGPVLLELRQELIQDRGFAVVRGLDVARYSEDELAVIFFGLGSHIGHAHSQNAAGHILGHVLDLGAKAPTKTCASIRPVNAKPSIRILATLSG